MGSPSRLRRYNNNSLSVPAINTSSSSSSSSLSSVRLRPTTSLALLGCLILPLSIQTLISLRRYQYPSETSHPPWTASSPRQTSFIADEVHEESNNTTRSTITTNNNINTEEEGNTTTATTATTTTTIPPRIWHPPSWSRFPCYDHGPFLKHSRRKSRTNITFPIRALVTKHFQPVGELPPPKHGLLFIKPLKVGGSTASGINLRISKNMAERLNVYRQQQRQQKQLQPASHDNTTNGDTRNNNAHTDEEDALSSTSDRPYLLCENSYGHTRGSVFGGRDQGQSFLWSLLRDPTSQAVSHFWHFYVSKWHYEPTVDNFIEVLSERGNYYIHGHYIQKPGSDDDGADDDSDDDSDDDAYEANKLWLVQDIMKQFNFLAITERFDESMVVLKLLLDRAVATASSSTSTSSSSVEPLSSPPLGDFLYLSAKVHGGYDPECYYIQPSNITPPMQEYLDSPQWRDSIKFDQMLYEAANASLDRTIDELLGRPLVERTLQLYRTGLVAVRDECQSVLPIDCNATTKRRPWSKASCLYNDAGCANDCVDGVANKLGLNI